MKKALGPVTLAYPMPAFLVAAYDEEGKANIMTAAWGGICCSNPPCIAVSVRPERWTHKAIVARKAFTVCVPSAAQAAMVDFAGMVSGAREDKFSATGLTAVRSKVVDNCEIDGEFLAVITTPPSQDGKKQYSAICENGYGIYVQFDRTANYRPGEYVIVRITDNSDPLQIKAASLLILSF